MCEQIKTLTCGSHYRVQCSYDAVASIWFIATSPGRRPGLLGVGNSEGSRIMRGMAQQYTANFDMPSHNAVPWGWCISPGVGEAHP